MTTSTAQESTESGIVRHVPGVRMLATYQASWLRFDLVAGLVLAAILVPQGLAYAELAGLPPVTGLYTTVACLVAYALLGPSRVLVLGPDSSVSPMILAAIVPLAAGGDPAVAITLAGMLALLVGAIEIGLGLGKLGFVADLLSKEVQVGYMNGLAITIIVGQLPKLFGFSTDADSFLAEIKAFVTGLSQTNGTTLAVGLGTLAVLFGLPYLTKRVPAVLVAVVGATVVTAALGLPRRAWPQWARCRRACPYLPSPGRAPLRRRPSRSPRWASCWSPWRTRSPHRRASPRGVATRSIPTRR